MGARVLSSCLVLSVVCCLPARAAEEAALPLLHEVYAEDFLVGVSLDKKDLPEGAETSLNRKLLAHFNVITPENDMKWERVQPAEGNFTFEATDAIVAYAEREKKQVVAHTLVWNNQTPDWVFKDAEGNPASRELALSRMRSHIQTVMQRYKERVEGWDVVNEALSDAPREYLREGPWLRTVGEDYVVQAFKIAREVDPDAKLYYNDFGLELPNKREKMIRLVKELQAAGAAPDAVNLQGHYSLGMPPIEQIEATIQAIADLGLRASISELDVSLFSIFQQDNPYADGAPAELLEKQAQRYGELFALFRKHEDKLDRITFWNLHDGVSWLNYFPVPNRSNYPLLFDKNGKPKPAFFAVVEAGRR